MIRVAVAGAGPVGLFLGCLLARQGVETILLEKRSSGGGSLASSRSIGLHPPALEALAAVDLAEPLVKCGIAIRAARVFDEGEYLGALPLEGCPPPFPFVLSLPQGVTERLLAEKLEEIAPGCVRKGFELDQVAEVEDGFELRSRGGQTVTSRLLVGCDGHRSRVRSFVAGTVTGGPSGNHYLMADLPDNSDLGADAALFLGRAGVVESFPLPGCRRRWVARLRERPAAADLELLREVVEQRTGRWLPAAEGDRASLFTAESRLARPIAGNRWALAGDAAHVVSPIGGQGMNLGILGAAALLDAGLSADWKPLLYDRAQRRRARRAAGRARLNMTLGGEEVPGPVRRSVLRSFLSRPLAARAARYFTMRGL